MPKTMVSQNSFTTGVISPTLMGRIDIAKYYSALAIGENITLMPHGGAKRRAGSRPVLKSKDMSLGYATTELYFTNRVRLEDFVFNIDQKYLIVFDQDLITIIEDDLKIHDITTAAVHKFTNEQLKKMDIIQYGDTMIIVHPDFSPMRLVRGKSKTDWTLEKIVFKNIPMYDYANNYLGKKEVFKGDGSTKAYVLIYTKPPFSVYLNGVQETAYTYDKDVGKVTFTTAPSATDVIDIISGAGVASKDSVHSYEDMWSDTRGFPKTLTIHQGRLYFGGTKSKPITVVGSVINDYFNFNLGDGEADMGIYDTIASGTFDDIVNITASRGLVVITESGEYYNSANPVTPATSSWQRQTAYGGDRQNTVEIDGALYFVDRSKHGLRQFMYSNEEDGRVSPNVALLADHLIKDIQRIAVSRGSKQDIANLIYVVNVDGSMSVLNTMRSESILGWSRWTTEGAWLDVRLVDETAYTLVTRGHDAAGDPKNYIEIIDESVLMDHYWQSGEGIDMFTADGIKTKFQLKNSTNGKFLVYIDGTELVVQPYYDAATNSIEFTFAPDVDAAIVVSPTDTTTHKMELPTSAAEHWGFLHMKGDFFYEGKGHPVLSGNKLILEFEKGHSYLETGFNFIPHLRTVKLNRETKSGSIINMKKRLSRVKLNVFNTLGISVENVRLADKKFIMSFDHQLQPFTGVKDVRLLGYSDQNSVDIVQKLPFPFTLLQIETEIKY